MSESLFAGLVTDGNAQDANSPRTFGFDFTAAVAGQITGIRYLIDGLGTGDWPATIDVALFAPATSTTVPLGTGSGTPTADGFLTVDLDTPVTIATDTTYTACAWLSLTSGGGQPNYDFLTTGLADDVTVGDLTALAGTGRFLNNTPSLAYPTGTSDLNFGVDVVFEPGAAQTVVEIGRPSETDTARAVDIVKRYTLGRAIETDTARAVARRKIVHIGRAVEHDTTHAVRNPAAEAGASLDVHVGTPDLAWWTGTPLTAWSTGRAQR